MELSSRKKRVQPAAPTGLPTHGYSASSIVTEYGQQVAAKQAALAAAAPSSLNTGLSSSTRRSLGTAAVGGKLSPLSMYNDAPQEEVTLDQFERAGVDRLQALKQLESIRLKKGSLQSKMENDPAGNPVTQVLTKYNLDNAAWDRLSHFVLRLAYCKTEELRRWLLTQESLLFKHRFDNESEETISNFLRDNDLQYEPLSHAELNEEVAHEGVSEEEASRLPTLYLKDLLHRVPFADPHQTVYYKVPFEDAIDLLRERKVLLRHGFAFVSRSNLSAIIGTRFRANLSLHLGQTCRATAQLRQDPRIVPLVSMLGKQYITPTYKNVKIEGAVTKEQLPTLAARSMPLCMSNLFKQLKEDNHLKHGGRMQLGLFLKGIGLSLNDALAFWKQSFARRIPPEKFDKEYAYNIRHNYGKEGKRTTYTPYGCVKIIMSSTAVGDHHGCPFKNFDEAHLRVKMREQKFTPPQCDDIITLVKGSHYQIACQRYYQFSHGDKLADNVGSHPNVYFDASENYYRELEANGGAAPTAGAPAAPTVSASAAAVSNGGYSAFATPTPSSAPSSATAPASTPTSSAPLTTAPTAASSSEPTPMDMGPDAPAAAAV